MTIWFDMDGTLVDLYKVKNWLERLKAEDSSPYKEAAPCLNLSSLARILNKLQKKGYNLGVISYLPPKASKEYNQEVKNVKATYLKEHLPSVKFDKIHLVNYGVPKHSFAKPGDIIFDDDENNRTKWGSVGKAYNEKKILKTLKTIYEG